MMYLDAPPRLIATEVLSAMPDHFRRKGARTDWADANRPGQPTDCFVLVADIGVLDSSCEERERRSNPAFLRPDGLLRFARNDGEVILQI